MIVVADTVDIKADSDPEEISEQFKDKDIMFCFIFDVSPTHKRLWIIHRVNISEVVGRA